MTSKAVSIDDEPSSQINGFVYVAVAVAAIGGLLFDYDTGVISGALIFVQKQFGLSAFLEEIVVSAVLVGAVLGAILGGALTSYYGRRKLIILAGVIFTASAIGTALAPSVTWLIVGRIASGIGIGIASFISPMYIAELAPAKVRGALVAVNMLAIATGIVVAYLVDYALSDSHAWRSMFGLAAIPSIALVLGMWPLPDSPRWLMSQGNIRDATRALQRLRTVNDVSSEVAEIKHSMAEQSGPWMKQLLTPAFKMPLIVGLGLAIFQQITGINTVMYYSPTIFRFAGIADTGPAILAGAGLATVMWCVYALAIMLLDRVGRRPSITHWYRGPDRRSRGARGGVSVPPSSELEEQHRRQRTRDLCRGVCDWAGAGVLAAHFRDLSVKSPWTGDERRDRDQLGNEFRRRRHVSDPGESYWSRRHVLALRGHRSRRLGFLLSIRSGNEREDTRADRGALAIG